MAPRRKQGPTFLWQAALILLPLLVLAALGLLSLRRDRALVEQEARQRAQELADDLASRLWTYLSSSPPEERTIDPESIDAARAELGAIMFTVSTRGELLRPPPVQPLSPQPADVGVLGPQQTTL